MSATDDEFTETIRKIISAQHFRMAAAAGAWLLMVRAAHGESGALGGVAANVEAERGVGLLELADRIEEARGWTEGAGAVAQQIAEQLVRAASKSAQSSETAEELRGRYHEVRGDVAERMAVLDGPVALSVADNGEIAKRRLLEEARETLEALGEEFALVIGGDAPAAPGGGGGGASGGGFGAVPAAGGRGVAPVAGGGAVATAGFVAPNGSLVGPGDYPYGHVLGPEQGDFAGWVVSPNTGFLTDPATGREFDPVTGRWIDPVTGRPFGEVTEYASRLSGLGAGPGAVAGIAGGAVVGAGGGLAGLYGGVMPPSVQHAGPARGQMMQQATRNLGHRAGVATRFALNEAAQGGRPFTPPPGSSADGRRTGAGAQPGRGGAPARPGAAAPAARGTRVFTPPPGAAHAVRGVNEGTGARVGAAGRAAGPPPAPGATGAAGARAGKPGNRTAPGRPGGLTEDRDVWGGARGATRGVLGE